MSLLSKKIFFFLISMSHLKVFLGELKLNIDDFSSWVVMFLNKIIDIRRYPSVDYHFRKVVSIKYFSQPVEKFSFGYFKS